MVPINDLVDAIIMNNPEGVSQNLAHLGVILDGEAKSPAELKAIISSINDDPSNADLVTQILSVPFNPYGPAAEELNVWYQQLEKMDQPAFANTRRSDNLFTKSQCTCTKDKAVNIPGLIIWALIVAVLFLGAIRLAQKI